MKYTKVLLLTILTASLVLAGCSSGEDKQVQQVGAYLGGTQGVTAEFEAFGVEEDGVFTIFDTETFPMEVTLRNKGEYEIQPGNIRVKLLGLSQDEVSGISSWEIPNSDIIDEISELVPEGGEETISFATDAKFEGEVNGFIDREWFANIDYDYQTYLIIPEVCLKEDLTDDRVCDVKEAKTFFSSGAPIIVKSVEESTAGKGVMALKIKVSNAGNGKITKPGEDFGVRNTLVYTIDDAAWECKSGGKIGEARFVSGEAEVVCKLKNPLAEDMPPSTKQVKLTFDYQYRDIIQEKLRMKESAE